MINFSKAYEEHNFYGGNEKKKTMIYSHKKYLVKFPEPIPNNKYLKNAYSEYIGSNIFKMSGFNTQNTILGIYKYEDKEKIVCACEDFTSENLELYEFESLLLSVNVDKIIDTELSDIIEIIEKLEDEFNIMIIDKFWDMFIIDALIGNADRHNGNWGFLYNKLDKTMMFAPIYDNGSCLNPLLEDEEISKLNDTELRNIIYNVYSCFKINNKKKHYFEFIKSRKDNNCNEALLRVFPNIDIAKIKEFILNIEGMSNIRKNFYISVLNGRYEILTSVYDKLKEASD